MEKKEKIIKETFECPKCKVECVDCKFQEGWECKSCGRVYPK